MCVLPRQTWAQTDREHQTYTTLLHAYFSPLVPSSTEMPSWSVKKKKKKVFHCHLWKIWVAKGDMFEATAAAKPALPIPLSACSIFVCMAATVWDF